MSTSTAAMMNKVRLIPAASQTMSQQIETYLARMRFMHRLPVASDNLYFGCVPPAVHEMAKAKVFDDCPPGRAYNLLLTMNQSARVTRENRLHVSVESPKEYTQAVRGQRGHERVFWVEIGNSLPCPRNSMQTPFWMPPDHPHYKEIKEWVDAAYKIDEEIGYVTARFDLLADRVGKANMAIASRAWPDLANFLLYTRGAPNNVSNKALRAAEEIFTEEFKNTTGYLLARAAMLPTEQPYLRAWVRFYTKEITG